MEMAQIPAFHAGVLRQYVIRGPRPDAAKASANGAITGAGTFALQKQFYYMTQTSTMLNPVQNYAQTGVAAIP